MKNLIFFGFATAAVFFSVIVLNVSPIIRYLGNSWYDEICSHYKDKYDFALDKTYNEINTLFSAGISSDNEKREWLDLQKEGKNICYRHKAMVGLEYATLNINVVFGFICAILGLLKYSGNNLGKIVGILGLFTGVIGFVLNLVYVIYSGIIFNNEVVGKKFDNLANIYNSAFIRTKSDGTYKKWDDSKKKYVCIFYDKENKDSVYARYSDFGNKVFNYNKRIKYPILSREYKYRTITSGCVDLISLNAHSLWEDCKTNDESTEIQSKYQIKDENGSVKDECDKLFAVDSSLLNGENKNKYDYWVTSIVLCCFVILFHIGLIIFGFVLFRESNELIPLK